MSSVNPIVKSSSLAFWLCLLNSQAFSYVVIENIESGNSELNRAAAAVQADEERATGELEEYKINEISDGWNFNARSRAANGPGNRSNDGSRSSRQLGYPRSNRFGSGGGGGGAGGGGRGRVRSRASEERRRIVQPMVPFNDDSTDADALVSDTGTDVSIFDSGQGSPATGGTGGLGGGGNFAGGSAEDEETAVGTGGGYGGRGTVVSGTPEPAALVIWAVVGTCGFGFLRYQRRKSES